MIVVDTRLLLTVLILAAGMGIGCGATRPISTLDAEAVKGVNDSVQEQRVVIELRDGQRVTGVSLRVRTDTTSWFDPEEKELRAVPTETIEAITIRRRLRGGIVGFFGGAVVGYVAYRRQDTAFLPSRLYVVPAMLIGGALGGWLGDPIRYELRRSD